jgi:hypothetical protein
MLLELGIRRLRLKAGERIYVDAVSGLAAGGQAAAGQRTQNQLGR